MNPVRETDAAYAHAHDDDDDDNDDRDYPAILVRAALLVVARAVVAGHPGFARIADVGVGGSAMVAIACIIFIFLAPEPDELVPTAGGVVRARHFPGMSAAIFVLVLSLCWPAALPALRLLVVQGEIEAIVRAAEGIRRAVVRGGGVPLARPHHGVGGRARIGRLAGRPVRVRGGGGLARRRVLPEPGRAVHQAQPARFEAARLPRELVLGRAVDRCDRGADVRTEVGSMPVAVSLRGRFP
mmetsp:Transcript_6620/g.16856  ORF Transcript_6620/g.16856 Transcript_6620/m.16856 type:complete len:241 (-) Transcript_6620:275-997(-)